MFEPVTCTRCIYQFNCMVRTEFTDADVKNKSGLNNLMDCAGKHAVKSCRNRNKIQFFTWTLGATIWFWRGGGGLAKAGTDYLFSAWARSENWFPRIPRPEYLFSSATNFWKSKKKKGGSECSLRRETRQDFPCVFFYFCRLPVMRIVATLNEKITLNVKIFTLRVDF